MWRLSLLCVHILRSRRTSLNLGSRSSFSTRAILGTALPTGENVPPFCYQLFVFLIIFWFLDPESLQTYGAVVDQVVAPLGEAITQSALEEALSKKKYKLVTFTHVDTSTGVLSDAKMIGETVKRISPETLVRPALPSVYLYLIHRVLRVR